MSETLIPGRPNGAEMRDLCYIRQSECLGNVTVVMVQNGEIMQHECDAERAIDLAGDMLALARKAKALRGSTDREYVRRMMDGGQP